MRLDGMSFLFPYICWLPVPSQVFSSMFRISSRFLTAIAPISSSCKLLPDMLILQHHAKSSDRSLSSCIIVIKTLLTSFLNKWTEFLEVLVGSSPKSKQWDSLHSFLLLFCSCIAVQIVRYNFSSMELSFHQFRRKAVGFFRKYASLAFSSFFT